MIKLKNITLKNFLSVGGVTQAVNFEGQDLTLVLGENLDLGGNDAGSRNGVGKCLGLNTIIKIRNSQTGEILETTIGEFYNAQMVQQSRTKL